MRTMNKEVYAQLRRALAFLRNIAIDKWPWSNELQLPSLLEKLEFDLLDFYVSLEALRLSKKYKERIDKALIYFCYLHKDQMRKRGNQPYFAHILRVATKVADMLAETQNTDANKTKEYVADIIISALAHDSVEDHAVSIAGGALMSKDVVSIRSQALKVVENKFGESVRHWVSVLSKPEWEDPRNKKREYSQWVQDIWQDGDWVSTILKLSDIFDNLESTINEMESFSLEANSSSKNVHKKMQNLLKKYTVILLDFAENYDEYVSGTPLSQKGIKDYINKNLKELLSRAVSLPGLLDTEYQKIKNLIG